MRLFLITLVALTFMGCQKSEDIESYDVVLKFRAWNGDNIGNISYTISGETKTEVFKNEKTISARCVEGQEISFGMRKENSDIEAEVFINSIKAGRITTNGVAANGAKFKVKKVIKWTNTKLQ